MEPSPRPTIVPPLHEIFAGRTWKLDSPRVPAATTPCSCSRAHDQLTPCNAPASVAQVASSRVFGASISYVDAPKLPLLHKPRPPSMNRSITAPSKAGSCSSNSSNHRDAHDEDAASRSLHEFRVLHPSLDLRDADGALSQLMLSHWSIDAGEHEFASISLFCETKLREARRMTSWVQAPNRFFTTACCQLLAKYIARLEQDDPSGSAAFLRSVYTELVCAIFMPTNSESDRDAESESKIEIDRSEAALVDRVPFFQALRKLQHHTQVLLSSVDRQDRATAVKERLPDLIDNVLIARDHQREQHMLVQVFRGWRRATKQEAEIRQLKCRAFLASRNLNISAIFRAWRIEALRRGYQRESTEYQTMLSITASSLSRKDVQISEADAKIASMAKIIDSLTESNGQLLDRVERLQHLAASKGVCVEDDTVQASRTEDTSHAMVPYERMDALITQDDEKMDHANRMLLEAMLGMARMVESCAIQLSKDLMDSLELQLDGSMLQTLCEMASCRHAAAFALIHEENVAKARSEQAKSQPQQPSSRNVEDNRATQPAIVKPMTIKELVRLPADVFLLYWSRLQLQLSTATEKASDRTIKNFADDLIDGRRYSFLLHQVFPSWFDAEMSHEIDVDERLKNVASFHARVQPTLPQVVTVDSIHSGRVTENVAFLAMIFTCSATSIHRIDLEPQRVQYLSILTSWKRVRSLMLEVKRMNDNYDALMVEHLAKEMRTCETLFRALQNDLTSIAVATNESSSAFTLISSKILQLTWQCWNAQATNQLATLELIDERWQERVKPFMTVDLDTVRYLLLRMLQGAEVGKNKSVGSSSSLAIVVPEKDVMACVQAVRAIVASFSKDLHDIFKHYSASTGTGSIATLSLGEFNKLVKDCNLSDARLTPSVIEAIFQSTVLHEPLSLHPTPANGAQQSTATTDTDEREMIGSEFVDMLLRVAAIKYPELPSLDERFRELMEQAILPNALRSQSEIFRSEVASPKIRSVFEKHKPALQRIFRYYASMHALREQQSTMDLKEFTTFAKDCRLLGCFVTDHTIKQVLVNLQRETDGPGDDVLRVDFADFQEAIAALTEYVLCNPYVPLFKRIEQFINDHVLPRARQKKRGARE